MCAQTPLELGSKTDFYVVPGGGKLMTRNEYVSRYRSDNSFQASNAVEVSVMHFNDTATVGDQRKKASPKVQPKTKGPVTSISLVFSRPIFDTGFGTFSAADMAQIRQALAKFRQWKTESAASPVGTEIRRPFPQTLLWPVAIEANNAVTLTEQPLLFLRDQKGAAFLLLDRDKAFSGGMEKVTATTTAGGAAAGAAGAAPAAGAGTTADRDRPDDALSHRKTRTRDHLADGLVAEFGHAPAAEQGPEGRSGHAHAALAQVLGVGDLLDARGLDKEIGRAHV